MTGCARSLLVLARAATTGTKYTRRGSRVESFGRGFNSRHLHLICPNFCKAKDTPYPGIFCFNQLILLIKVPTWVIEVVFPAAYDKDNKLVKRSTTMENETENKTASWADLDEETIEILVDDKIATGG